MIYLNFVSSACSGNLFLIAGIVGTISTGHSEGIQIEYIAVYVAVVFPGALVALNYDSLQILPQLRMLRIYCAGVWHNAVVSLTLVLGLKML